MKQKSRTWFLFWAAVLAVLGGIGFFMPLIRGSESGIFALFGPGALIAKIACLAAAGACLVIGIIRYVTGPHPSKEPKVEEKPAEKPGEKPEEKKED